MLPFRVLVDRIVLVYKNVYEKEYQAFVTKIQSRSFLFPDIAVVTGTNTSIKGYRHNLRVGFGEGAIRIDYKHNRIKSTSKNDKYDMRIEFNPQKMDKLIQQKKEKDVELVDHAATSVVDREVKTIVQRVEVEEFNVGAWFFKTLNTEFYRLGKINRLTGESDGHVRMIKMLDIAFDFPIAQDKLIIMSLTGKERDRYKGTYYWGGKMTDGYLKNYDKKKEREDHNDKSLEKYENVTRIEYTFSAASPITIDELERHQIDISSRYKLSVFDQEKLSAIKIDSALKAHILCYMHNLMDMEEFSRRYKENTKKVLQEMGEINLTQILAKQWNTVLETVKKYIRV